MVNLNLDEFSEEYQKTAPMECACYLTSCLSKEVQEQLKKDWNNAGGINKMPYFQWCLNNIDVVYNPQK